MDVNVGDVGKEENFKEATRMNMHQHLGRALIKRVTDVDSVTAQ